MRSFTSFSHSMCVTHLTWCPSIFFLKTWTARSTPSSPWFSSFSLTSLFSGWSVTGRRFLGLTTFSQLIRKEESLDQRRRTSETSHKTFINWIVFGQIWCFFFSLSLSLSSLRGNDKLEDEKTFSSLPSLVKRNVENLCPNFSSDSSDSYSQRFPQNLTQLCLDPFLI